MYKLLFFFYHYVPAFFADIILRCRGSKLRIVKIYTKVFYYLDVYNFYVERKWKFSNTNLKQIFSKMSEKDHHEFPCTAIEEAAIPFIKMSYIGLRKHFLKETDKDMLEGRRRYIVLKTVYYILWGAIYCSFACYLFKHKTLRHFLGEQLKLSEYVDCFIEGLLIRNVTRSVELFNTTTTLQRL